MTSNTSIKVMVNGSLLWNELWRSTFKIHYELELFEGQGFPSTLDVFLISGIPDFPF